MLKSCHYCGGIDQRNYKCPSKQQLKRKKESNDLNRFRWSRLWVNKSKWIRQRDKYLCQICLREQYYTQTKYNFNNLEVHHIVPLNEGWDKRLEDSNLITLCAYHHKMADRGEIPRDELAGIVSFIQPN